MITIDDFRRKQLFTQSVATDGKSAGVPFPEAEKK